MAKAISHICLLSVSVRRTRTRTLTFAVMTSASSIPNQPLFLNVMDRRHIKRMVAMEVKVTVTHRKSCCSPG